MLSHSCCRHREASVRRYTPGLCGVVPDRALRLCTWQNLQRLACGESYIDVAMLRHRNVVYDSRGIFHDEHLHLLVLNYRGEPVARAAP